MSASRLSRSGIRHGESALWRIGQSAPRVFRDRAFLFFLAISLPSIRAVEEIRP